MDLGVGRVDYDRGELHERDALSDPFDQLQAWLRDAEAAGVPEPLALALSTVGADGTPSSRNLLLRGVDTGLVVYTNLHSHKAVDLAAHPRCCALFSWLGLQRQIRVTADAEPVDTSESDAYFATRPRGSQIGAWASDQSTVVASRAALEEAWAEAEKRFAGQEVPRPDYWGGLRLVPTEFEFWQGRTFRLHDRLRYRRSTTGWAIERLAP